jgi:hypothetical protein
MTSMMTLEEQATARSMSLLAAGVPLTLLIDLAFDAPYLLGEEPTAPLADRRSASPSAA